MLHPRTRDIRMPAMANPGIYMLKYFFLISPLNTLSFLKEMPA
jgi:hypothetical protein